MDQLVSQLCQDLRWISEQDAAAVAAFRRAAAQAAGAAPAVNGGHPVGDSSSIAPATAAALVAELTTHDGHRPRPAVFFAVQELLQQQRRRRHSSGSALGGDGGGDGGAATETEGLLFALRLPRTARAAGVALAAPGVCADHPQLTRAACAILAASLSPSEAPHHGDAAAAAAVAAQHVARAAAFSDVPGALATLLHLAVGPPNVRLLWGRGELRECALFRRDNACCDPRCAL